MKKIFHQFFITIFVVGSILLCADFVRACSCGPSIAINEVFDKALNIAILKVETVKKFEKNEIGFNSFLPNQVKESRLKVVKVFKGNLTVGQELSFGGGSSGNCTITFNENSIGHESLLFLSSEPTNGKFWEASYCWRSGSLASQYTDLSYLNNIEKVRGKTRLSGMVVQITRSALEGVSGTSKVFSNRKVYVIGNGKNIELTTDKNGVFEVYDLPFGRYELKTEGVEGYRLSPRNKVFRIGKTKDGIDLNRIPIAEIEPNGQVELDLVFEIDNSISGKMLDSNGKPLSNVSLDLRPAKGKEYQFFYKSAQTFKDGSFKFDTIPPGEYLIEVNHYGYISGNTPFNTFFYPNDKVGEKAIQIGAGQHIKDLLIVPPSTTETVTISGKVNFENRENINDFFFLNFITRWEPLKSNSESKNQIFSEESFIDKDGNFSLKILKGQKGKLFVTRGTTAPALDKCQGNSKINYPEPLSESVEIEGDKNIGNIEFKVKLPSCKKAKID